MRLFDPDLWREILETIRRGKLRTAATAISVAWGIFMLVVLLGAGRGIQTGIETSLSDDAQNSIWLFPGSTSKAFAGYGRGRSIPFSMDDYGAMVNEIDRIEHASARFYLQGEFTVRYRHEVSSFVVRACHPGHRFIEGTIITGGRFLNHTDLEERRKVAVIGPRVVEILYGRRDPIGTWLEVRGTPYRVVGTFEDNGWEGERSIIYVPITTAQTAYGGGDRVDQMMFTVGDASAAESEAIVAQMRTIMSSRKAFAKDDRRAIRTRNTVDRAEKFRNLFEAINGFLWIVGFGTILAGIVGVSNIMLISVRERTREIGIRKALGATPRVIVSQIVLESLLITAVAGYVGMVLGLVVLEAIRQYVPPNDYFRDPEVRLSVVLAANAVLVAAGAIAGYLPARWAARVHPVEALRAE